MNDDPNPQEIPWPQAGDTMFRSDGDWRMNACLNLHRADWYVYATGYKNAADVLVEHVANTRHQLDTLVYPITFLYRHYIELRLKELILASTNLLGTDLPRNWPKEHRIESLWKHSQQDLRKIWPEGSQSDLDAVTDCINQFAAIDPIASSFRYPVDTGNKPHITGLTHINIRNLSKVIGRIAGLLDSASSGISEYLDQKRDMESSST